MSGGDSADTAPGGSQTFCVHLLDTLFVVYVLACMFLGTMTIVLFKLAAGRLF